MYNYRGGMFRVMVDIEELINMLQSYLFHLYSAGQFASTKRMNRLILINREYEQTNIDRSRE